MKPSSLPFRILGALVLTVLLLADYQWRGQSLAEVPLWAWGALALALVVIMTQWPQRSSLPILRRVPLGWRVGVTVGLFMFLFTLADRALPRPDWGFAVWMGLAIGLLFGYVWNQSYTFKGSRP